MSQSKYISILKKDYDMLKNALVKALQAQQNIEKKLQGNKAAVVSTTAPRKGPSVRELAMKRRQQFHDKKATKP